MIDVFKTITGAPIVMKLNFVLRESSTKRDQGMVTDALRPGTDQFIPDSKDAFTGAISNVHADFTDDCVAVKYVRDMLDGKRGRFALYNAWRPVRNVAKRWPLAVCDVLSVAPEDMVYRETPENNNSVLNCSLYL